MELTTIRTGMWVTHADGRVGVLNDLNATAMTRDVRSPFYVHSDAGVIVPVPAEPLSGEFHQTDAKGITVRQEIVALDELSQARWREIPEARRPDRASASRLGYSV